MKQIIQHLQTGETTLVETPVPQVRKGCVLIKTHCSLVSLGTEKMLVQFGKSNLLSKAQQQPEKVKQVLAKIKTDGFRPTFDAVRRKLNEPIPLGYCNVGEVIAIGAEVSEFKIGDRVVSNGKHAEVVCVPKNLVALIPDEVSDEEATFTVVGAIALQSIRLVNPTFGETVTVIGLGLIGQLTAELLLANGCEVIAFDFEQSKVDLAISKGIKAFKVKEKDDSLQIAKTLTKQIGVDAVIITASTTSNEVIAQAAQMSRKRGRIVLVGVIGLDIQRADFYEKELSFQVSCSYGAGRYETNYEQNGQDYPIGFVRWTVKRNFETVLNAIAKKKLQVNSLITQKVAFENFQEIYSNIGKSNAIASILEYSEKSFSFQDTVQFHNNTFEKSNDILAIIGAGNFTKATVLPHLKKLKAKIKYISSSNGLSASIVAQQFGITKATSNNEIIFNDPEVSAVIITTQHNTHAKLCIEALKAGKHVFVEKPLALTQAEIDEIIEVYQQSGKTLTVGFNRRFSPFMQDAKKQLGNNHLPMNVIATMNAGCIPSTHWTQDMSIGGGRIIGEACHLIDLITFLTGSLVENVVMNAMEQSPSLNTDNATILLKYQNGSTGVINYFSNGHKSYSKERIEIYSQGRTIIVDNFRKSTYYGFKNSGFSQSQDKGHFQQFKLWLERLQNGGEAIIPFEDVINTSKASIEAVSTLAIGKIMFV